MDSSRDRMARETSPAPSSRGLKGLLAKARGSRKDSSSAASVNGTEGGSEIRNSVDSLIDKERFSRKSSTDDGAPSTGDKMSKLIPNRIKRRRRKREEAEQQRQDDEQDRGIKSSSSQTATSRDPSIQTRHKSQSTLDDDGEGSLITLDSDPESVVISAPPLVSHPSHVGYLTSSSPLIKSNAVDPSTVSHLEDPAFQPPGYQKSTTFPDSVNSVTTSPITNLAPRNAATLDSREIERSLNTSDAAGSRNGRGISPGAKIKDVFTGGSRKKSSSPPKSPDRASSKSFGSGNTRGGILGLGDKMNSVNLSQSSVNSEKPPHIPQPISTDAKGSPIIKRDLPAIITSRGEPRTPPSASLDTPLTTVTPPTPTDQRPKPPGSPSVKPQPTSSMNNTSPSTITSASDRMISHRRIRSDSATYPPSKLSSAMSAPLTPTIEETKTPGARSPGVQGSPGGPGGFFSSVFSAAQNAANTLSNTIANNPPRSRSSTQTIDEESTRDNESSSVISGEAKEVPLDQKKKLAVDTLGTGDLSLDHLGITTDTPMTGNSTNGTFPTAANGSSRAKDTTIVRRDEAAARAEDVSAARAVSAAYTEKASAEKTSTPVAEDIAPGFRSRSTYENSIAGDKTPPNGSIFEGEHGFRRTGSVRSRVGAVARRHRNSSGATGNTIGAAIGASHAAITNPTASASTPKLTGFAVASKKRNREFHQLFRSVPEDDYLIEDYSCALQRDIILAGRIYVSEGHICFSSNILGWVTTLIISFDEVVSVEKENTAMVFPNAIAIQTLHARQTFRSLLSREATYELLIGIWKLSHPSLKSSINGVQLDTGGTGDKTEKADPSGSDEVSDISEDEEEVYDEDEGEDEGQGNFTEAGNGSVAGSEDVEPVSKPSLRKPSAMGQAIGSAAGSVPTQSDAKNGEKAAAAGAASADFPGPATHAPTECSDQDTHYDKILKDEIVPAPLGKVYSMVFGPASGGFMTKWLLDEQKVTDLQMEDDKKGLSDGVTSRSYSYIKPLYASIGPKQTKCLITETLDAFDLDKAVSVTVSTQTPDVPSGNVFTTKTKFCFTWAPGNATKVFMNSTVEWTGKSWLKGPIEKGASDGQMTYANDLVKALKSGLTSKSRPGTLGSKGKVKGKRRKGDTEVAGISSAESKSSNSHAQTKSDSWGLFEPLHGALGPVVDIVSPLISANMVIGFLLITLLITWYRGGSRSPSGNHLGFPGLSSPERIVAYEEIWRGEESDLWNWLEERVGMESLAYPASLKHHDQKALKEEKAQRELSNSKGKGLRAKLADEAMNKREMEHAIQVTEERLNVLKAAIQKNSVAPEKDAANSQEAKEEGDEMGD